MKIIDIQNNRNILLNRIKSLDCINKYSKILVWNFWYIIVPNDKNKDIFKYFFKKDYFDKEINNYNIYYKNNILTPKINIIWKVNLSWYYYFWINIENIRKYKTRYYDIKEINAEKLWDLLSKIHSIDFDSWISYLHWNLHESNFFEDKNWNLGIFDLVSMFYWNIEYDFSIIYINSMFDDTFILNLLKFYKYKDYFDINKMYKFTIINILNRIKLNQPIKKEGIEQLKKELFKLKIKLWNLT